ncbi:Lectin receptor-like kinase [Quillaja saponaria]|uniref:non-specific serine/threonine protein kinase n=1 Tax=Quillaja saponaria TaxID=32244 RepID=A0AAD7LPL1_QUISA|nr:Lectin receptor-like kinase [Quillaja saponaria]
MYLIVIILACVYNSSTQKSYLMAVATSLAFLLLLSLRVAAETEFIFNGFSDTENNLTLEGASIIKPTGLLKLTNRSQNVIGHAFYHQPIQMFDNIQPNASSFATSFVFAINPPSIGRGGYGLAFTLAPSTKFPGADAGHYLGLVNQSNDGVPLNRIFVVEFDTVKGYRDSADTEGNHIGINVNGLNSIKSEPAAYYENGTDVKDEFNLASGIAIHAWIEYDGAKQVVNVTVAPFTVEKPWKPLMSVGIDLTHILKQTMNMYVGFSAATGEKSSSDHYILGWSFATNGVAPPLNDSQLPEPPPMEKGSSSLSPLVKSLIGALCGVTFILFVILFFSSMCKRYRSFESLEAWELVCPRRFRYRDLHTATNGFKESEIIGVGGFGSVYKGVLPSTGNEVAVKKVVRSSIHGMREYAAEIESLGKLRHKNLVNLQGWCKKKDDLLIIYDYIPNGSLDYLLFNPVGNFVLDWYQRFNIIKGIAAGLLYLHEEWEQVVIHRDVKTSNVLIDADMNARLGDFGLARLYDHGQLSYTTNLVGTIGYIAPELTRTSKASTSSDVYAYGVLLLEVVSGRRPIGLDQFFLVDWVIECYQLNQILDAVDPKLNSVHVVEEVELVLKLGLLCTHHRPDARPTMRQVIRYLNHDDPLPDTSDWGSMSGSGSRFLETICSNNNITTSYNLSSSIEMTSSSIEAGR